jgi:hypothetical protein
MGCETNLDDRPKNFMDCHDLMFIQFPFRLNEVSGLHLIMFHIC